MSIPLKGPPGQHHRIVISKASGHVEDIMEITVTCFGCINEMLHEVYNVFQ